MRGAGRSGTPGAGRSAKGAGKGGSGRGEPAGRSGARSAGRSGAGAKAAPRGGDPRVGRPQRDPKGIGGEQVEGRQAVRELLRAGRRRVRDVWIADDVEQAPIISEIERLAIRNRVALSHVPRGKLEREARTDAPQGVIAHAAALPDADLDALASDRRAFLLLLDGVTDPHNLGALVRTAEHAGVTGVVLPRHRAAHVTPTVAKAAAGAVEHVPIALVPGLPGALLRLGQVQLWRIGLDQDAPRSLFDLELDLAEPVALVLGGEGEGLGRLTRQRCDEVVGIPRAGVLESLNVAAAGAVALYEVARRRIAAAGRRSGDA